MPQIILRQWKPGLKKVSVANLLQEKAALSLREAKQCVDNLLDGESVSIDIPAVEEAVQLVKELTSFGVVCEVIDRDKGLTSPN